MINELLYQFVLKSISKHALSPVAGKDYAYKDSIKNSLLDPANLLIYNFTSGIDAFSVEIPSNTYKDSLFSDYFFGRERIAQQKLNLETQLANGSQAAWVLVTCYYASFFMATEIAKLCGNYMINFSTEDMHILFSQSSAPLNVVLKESNYGYQVKTGYSDFDKKIKLSFYKKSPRPHVETWKNLTDIVRSLTPDDSKAHFKTLFLSICDSEDERWDLPSKIRNDWNYRYANYYGEKGNSLGEVFYKNIKSHDSSVLWASRRAIQPHQQNIVASLSFIYYSLLKTLESLDHKLSGS